MQHCCERTNVDDKTLHALTNLAAKLGTTAEYLWGALLRQAPITGTIDLLVMSAWVAGCVAWFRFVHRKTTRPAATDEDRYPRAAWNDEFGVGLAWMSVAVFVLISALVIGSELSNTVAALVNPEYWALRQILK
jgi:hypothetical protein